MKRLSFLCLTSFIMSVNYAQSLSLLTDDVTPVSRDTVIKQTVQQNPNNKGVTLYAGVMNPVKGGNTLLPKKRTADNAGVGVYAPDPQITPLSSGNAVGGNGPVLFQDPITKGSVLTVTTNAPKSAPQTKTVTKTPVSSGNNNFASLTDNNTYNAPTTNTSTQNNGSNNQLAPLTDDAVKPLTTASTTSSYRATETVAPSLMNAKKIVTSTAPAKSNTPELAPVETTYSTPKYKMPALATIENKNGTGVAASKSKSLMPELAPIEGEGQQNKVANQASMPELAPIEDESNAKPAAPQQSSNKVKTNLRGLIMPVGTTMTATDRKSFLFKPAIAEEPTEKKDNSEEVMSTKPSAGGGMGMPALAPIVEESKKTTDVIPELAPIENRSKPAEVIAMPALAPIQNTYQQQPYQQAPAQQKVVKTNYVTKKQQLLQAAKNHQHDPNNPCCQVQMYNPNTGTVAKKVVAKKPVYHKKKRVAYRQPVQYIYVQEPQQTQTVERIVYVPAPQQQANKTTTQVYKPEPQPAAVAQPQQKVIYKTYTNAYAKPSTPVNTTPATNYSNNSEMKYTFYINTRGKYSVGVYNNNCTIFLGQNGRFSEYKINGDPNANPNNYKPKLNSYGDPESVAGIPIEYNYDRTIHKIGNVVFEYDFEGYFAKVGSSNVSYTSRSSLAKVDNILVHYDPNANVTSVDQNDGLIQFNP